MTGSRTAQRSPFHLLLPVDTLYDLECTGGFEDRLPVRINIPIKVGRAVFCKTKQVLRQRGFPHLTGSGNEGHFPLFGKKPEHFRLEVSLFYINRKLS
jgi:hypothetical protein